MNIIVRVTVEYAGGAEPFEQDFELEGTREYSSLDFIVPKSFKRLALERGDVQRYSVAVVARYA